MTLTLTMIMYIDNFFHVNLHCVYFIIGKHSTRRRQGLRNKTKMQKKKSEKMP